MATKTKKTTKVQKEKREYKSNVIQFSSIKKTRTGIAVWIGSNVLFINDGLLNYIKKAS
jgi:hypothetical protein